MTRWRSCPFAWLSLLVFAAVAVAVGSAAATAVSSSATAAATMPSSAAAAPPSTASSSSSSPSGGAGSQSANGPPFLTLQGTLPVGQFFRVEQILAGGWSRAALCSGGSAGSGGDSAGSTADCVLSISITQNYPNPSSSACSLGALVQVDCLSQTNQDNYAQMVCVSSTSASGSSMIFPQDSPNYAFNQTIWTGLRTEAGPRTQTLSADASAGAGTGARGGLRPETLSGSSSAGTEQSVQGGFIANPITVMFSPSTFAAMEAVALRNLEPSNRGEDTQPRDASAGPSTLPINLVLLNQQKLVCNSPIEYTLVARIVNNTLCASSTTIPPHTQWIPGTNHTNASTIIVPGTNVTTPVACQSSRGTCLIQPSDLGDPGNGNTTAMCLCDRGFEYDQPSGSCLERSTDLTNLGALARPTNYNVNITDPSSLWKSANNMNPKGGVLVLADVMLNVSEAAGSRQRLAPRISGVSGGGGASSIDASPLGSSSSFSSYFFARTNISRRMQDLALIVHVTLHLEDFPPGSDPPPMQISFSPDFYPAVFVNTALGCLNASDLTGQGPTGAAGVAATDPAAGAGATGVGEVIIDASTLRRVSSSAGGVRLDSTQTSCSIFYQSYPDVGIYASPRSFKVLFQPAMISGFLNRSAIAPGDFLSVTPLYFSVYFEANARVDIRSWWQGEVGMMVPLHPRSGGGQQRKGTGVKEEATEDAETATETPTSGPSTDAAASATDSAAASTVTDAPPLRYVGEISSNQSWVQLLLENELVYFTFNETGPLSWGNEDASLYFVLNDTSCVSGSMSQGWFAPHWWKAGEASYAQAVAGGMNPGGGPPPPLEPYVPPTPAVQGISSGSSPPLAAGVVQGISGGCIRPNQRYLPTPASQAGYFGKLFSTCSAPIELNVWHITPYALDTRLVDQWFDLTLNATGSGCYREFTLGISPGSSIPNDLLVSVDQSDAQILLRMAPNIPAPPPSYPTLSFQYNSTTQYPLSPEDDAGDERGWVQRNIAYLDLSVTQVWYLSVFLDPSGGTSLAAYPPRTFRVKISWATESSFAHFSKTLIIIFSCIGSLACLLLLLAIKLRVDNCRRSKLAHRTKTQKMQEKIRLMQAGKPQEYMRM